MDHKKRYVPSVVVVHGTVESLTRGSRIALSDAWLGTDGNDGLFGPKCSPDSERFACTADGS